MRAFAATLCVWWVLAPAISPAQSDDGIVWGCEDAGYTGETTEYAHGVLGDKIEYKSLVLKVPTGAGTLQASLDLPDGQVFEDIAPRCGDLDGDGNDEVVTIIADAKDGARLAIYSPRFGPIAETPPIGQGFRWLAPIGIGDFNGDGRNEVAYVDRPHLAGILRVWQLQDGKLVELANAQRFSNHRIGENFITGGVRNCGTGDEMIVPAFDWSGFVATRMDGDKLVLGQTWSDPSPDRIKAALDCTLE